MWLTFVFWATQATWKFYEEEVSTTSFNVKSDDMKSEIPRVTLCPLSYLHENREMILNWMDDSIDGPIYVPGQQEYLNYYFYERLENDFDLSMYDLNNSVFYDIHDMIEDVYINDVRLKNATKNAKPVYHYKV